ncbi:MAG TPA: N-acetylmuramoyl-L-alanine amidase [Chitinophagaceae bacterium]|jgi:N-acetylmuramoyl-L-alanine amidase|nr:N-acetylmuramoyl-L-alanine amidase [Chitinophagaceae bacterium]
MGGKTTGPLPYLEYGLGSDRLGGAKMTYLDTNVVVNVTDSVGDKYKIRLSKNHMAFLPKENFKQDTAVVFRPYYLTGSWKVFGDDQYDYVTVALDEKLPYSSRQEINPSRIVVDIYGVTSNTNWITQLSTVKEIKNAYYEQPEDDVFRMIIELKHRQHWGYSIYYEENKLVLRVKRQPSVLSLANMKIAVDAGHGGENEGASGAKTAILEKDYTLKIAKELKNALLKEKAHVFMTREKDTTLSMVERISMLKQAEPDFLISIHLNSSGEDTVKGVSTYYRYIGFRPLTQFILKRMLELRLNEFGNVGSFNFSLSGPTDYPNCLVEVAFLSNKEDERRIRTTAFQKAVAAKIVQGIKDWLRSLN